MMLRVWHVIVSATLEVRVLLDRALPNGNNASRPTSEVGSEVQQRVRDEILGKLGQLRSELKPLLSEKEVGMVLLPLVIHFDELVVRRLGRPQQSAWPLLQQELFDLTCGGEVFFEFASERMSKPDTPPLVFEVLLFCLNDGFLGQYSTDAVQLAQFKRGLIERIPLPALPTRPSRRRAERDAEPTPKIAPVNPRWLWLGAASAVLLMFGLTALLTNL